VSNWSATFGVYRGRFIAVYSALALAVAGSAVGAYFGATATPPAPKPRCWTSAPDISAALYSAAFCRFGKANVEQLGWMPHIQANGFPSETLDEVAVIRTRSGPSYWLAHVVTTPRVTHVQQWTPCGAVC
jgi:hypothetical protein